MVPWGLAMGMQVRRGLTLSLRWAWLRVCRLCCWSSLGSNPTSPVPSYEILVKGLPLRVLSCP